MTKVAAAIKPLPTYPDNGNHLYVEFNQFVPFDIIYGVDGAEPGYWYVVMKTKKLPWDVQEIRYFIQLESGRFKTAEEAIDFAVTKWTEYLSSNLTMWDSTDVLNLLPRNNIIDEFLKENLND